MNTALYIIEALQGGDELIFKQVYEEYHQKIYSRILSKTRSEYLAEEVVQLTFIKFWQYRTHLSEQYALSTQLYRIATTTLVDLLRKKYANDKKVEAKRCLPEPIWEYQRNTVDEKGFHVKLNQALDVLPLVRRQAFEMSRLEGMSYKEIAATLSISEKAVENHIYKATRRVRKLISSEFIPQLIIFSLFFE